MGPRRHARTSVAWVAAAAGLVMAGTALSPASAEPSGVDATTTTRWAAASTAATTPATSTSTSASTTTTSLTTTSTTTTSTTTTTTTGLASPGTLSISAPGRLDVGTAASAGRVISARMGAVTVTDTRGVVGGAWTARVSATAFTIEGGAAGQPVAPCSIAYWSGPATARSGTAALAPGQPGPSQAVPLTATRTAFSATRVTGANTAAWNPTVIVRVPAGALAGRYRGAIIHSVA
jgi:hypothetical protein